MELVTLVGISGIFSSLSMIGQTKDFYGKLACVSSALWALLWTLHVTLS